MEQVDELSLKVKALERSSGNSGYLKKVLNGTTFGGYGELDYAVTRNNGNNSGKNSFDPHRIVLYVNSDLADWITFSSELEWEHGGKSSLNDGEAAVEQAFLDFKLSRGLNVKTGLMLVPVGAINLYHEPTNFNSTERPELDKFLVPSTWREMGAGIHGAIGDRANYQLYVMNGLNGSKFSAKEGIRKGRQGIDVENNKGRAVSGRLEVNPTANLYTNLSFYSGNAAEAGKGNAWTTVAAFDGKYSINRFDISGEYVHVYQDDPAALGVTEIGHNMAGYWVEGAYHVMPTALKKGKLAEADAVVFARYSEIDTQAGGALDATKESGKYHRKYTTFGISFKPVTTVAIKADYQIYDDNRAAGETAIDNDKFQVTVGFVF